MLYMPLCTFKEEVREEVKRDLKEAGIKLKLKTRKSPKESEKQMAKIFNGTLGALPTEKLTLQNNVTVNVPIVLNTLAKLVMKDLKCEGLFQREIEDKEELGRMKQVLEHGGPIASLRKSSTEYAVLIKEFLRELTEPIIPSDFHESFFQALTSPFEEGKERMVLLCCLALPDEHLETLLFLLDLFNDVASYSNKNKVSLKELSACVGPIIFRIDPRNVKKLANVTKIMMILIKNNTEVGTVPQYILNRMDVDSLVISKAQLDPFGNICSC